MFAKWKTYRGYILTEAIVAFMVICLLTTALFELVTFLCHQEKQATIELEAYRFLYEASQLYQRSQETGQFEKTSQEKTYALDIKKVNGHVQLIVQTTNQQTYQIKRILLEEQNSE